MATDYEPCPFMEEANPEYFIMQKTLENTFIQKGISETKLLNTGIPVSSNFIKNAKSIRWEYNISDDEKVVLIMLGSMGFGEIDNIINPLLKENIKIIVICGTNKQLYEKLNEYKNDNLIVIGFTKNINDFIYSSDYVLSKPGGLSSTEIASIHKPLLHIYPIPGIETYNTLFFENYTEEELKQQEKFQKSIHLLNELYFEYGSLENIPILPFDPENIREGDSLFTEVVAVINTENNETYFVTENDDMKLLKKCLEKLQYYNGNSVTKSNEELTEAIKNFQKEEGLTIDGIAGNEVWRKIDILMLNKVIEDD